MAEIVSEIQRGEVVVQFLRQGYDYWLAGGIVEAQSGQRTMLAGARKSLSTAEIEHYEELMSRLAEEVRHQKEQLT